MIPEEQALLKAFGDPRVNPKQIEFLNARTLYVGYGGARGGGKSHIVRQKATGLAYRFPGIEILIVRRTLPELRKNHILKLQAAYGKLPEYMRPTYSEQNKEFKFPNGSMITMGYCDKEADVLRYQGQEYDVIFLEEGTHLTEFQFHCFDALLRGTSDFPRRMYVTCNPGGVGHSWVKRLFIDREYRGDEKPSDYQFIQALVWDNMPLFWGDQGYKRYLTKLKRQRKVKEPTPEMIREAQEHSDYVRKLSIQSPEMRKAWLDGDWNIFAGQYFGEFSEDTHTCEPRKIPSHWRRSLALDYGLDMLAVLWFAVDEHGFPYCYRSFEQPNLTVSMAAEKIKRLSGTEKIERYIAPPDLWNRRQDTGKSAADIFRQHGIPLIKAGNSRVDGWLNVKEYLKIRESTEQPGILFFNDCDPILRCIPELQHDIKKINDVATEPHEFTHSPDALRYWCSQRQLSSVEPEEEKPDPFKLRRRRAKNVSSEYLTGGFRN